MSGDDFKASRKTRPRGYIDAYQPQAKTLKLLKDVEVVLGQYRDYWPLTVRQISDRLVGAFDYPKDEAEYGKICHHVANARRARIIPFNAIRDDGVSVSHATVFHDKELFFGTVRVLGEHYHRDRMYRQPFHIEVWCEAAGMVPQLARVADVSYDIPVYSSSGFDSLTAKKTLADRIVDISKPTVILHLGDFDPSGESIFRSVEADVQSFVRADRLDGRASVEFHRVALHASQVELFSLPTAPAKSTDSRSRGWQGGTCQLEALAPDYLATILRDAIEELIDDDQFDADVALQKRERQEIAFALPEGRGS